MRVLQNTDTDALMKLAAQTILDSIQAEMQKQDKVVVGIVGGRSMSLLFPEIVNNATAPLKNVHFIMLDERRVPLDDEESNYYLAKTALFDPLVAKGIINKENIHPLPTQEESPEEGYSKTVEDLGDIDIAILSSGEDNHVAAIYPGHTYPETTYAALDDSPKPPPNRITITPTALAQAKQGFIFFNGPKHEALRNFMDNKDLISIRAVMSIQDLTIITDIEGNWV
jgi:6-phosphogluconolactonase